MPLPAAAARRRCPPPLLLLLLLLLLLEAVESQDAGKADRQLQAWQARKGAPSRRAQIV